MENPANKTSAPTSWKKSLLWLALAVACFHAAYTSVKFPAAGLFIFGYAFGLVKLCEQGSVRRAFYFGLVAGYLCYAPQAFFLWNILSGAAVILWLVLAFWVALFTTTACGAMRRWGKTKAVWLIPILWTGIEYFRSELYFLKFSWLNVGYLSTISSEIFGMYGSAFLLMVLVILVGASGRCYLKITRVRELLAVVVIVAILAAMLVPAYSGPPRRRVNIVGIQLEFPSPNILPKILSQALAKNTNGQIFVLSEYTLNEKPGGVPDALKDWCREHGKFLVVGGKAFVTNEIYYNTAFVVGTNGDLVLQLGLRLLLGGHDSSTVSTHGRGQFKLSRWTRIRLPTD